MATAKKRNSKTTKKATLPQIGDTGTRILDGIISEEYNSKLADTRGIAIYDEMRKSDGTIQAGLKALTLPIRSANWYVKPASEEQADRDISDFVQACLWEYQALSWSDFLRQALLMLPFGVMAFEKVYGTREVDGQLRIVFDKLAPRLPRSIQKWAIADSQPGITQNTSTGKVVEIPMEKLIVFVNEMEGDNWWGTSVLRAAYKHWFIKSTIEKIDAIAHERQGLGVPKGTLPDNYTEADRQRMEDILKNLRANSQAYLAIPPGYTIEFMDMMAKATRDPANSLAYHSREILKSILAQFLELGSTTAGGTGGSRALSEDHSKLFLQSEEAYARQICGVMNVHIRELVDLNFENVEAYPELDFDGITTINAKEAAETYSNLINSGGITPQDADETYFREVLDMPDLDEAGIRERPQPKGRDIDEDADPREAHEHRHGLKKNFAEGFKPFRKLTFAEEKVNFQSLHDKMDELEEQFDTATRELLESAREEYMAKFTKAALDGDTTAIKNATLKVQADYSRILKNAAKSSLEFGKTNAAKEIGVAAPGNPAEMLRQIDIQSAAIADMQIAEIVADSKNAYVEARNKGASTSAALGAADAAAAAAIDRLTRDTKAILVSGYVNHGRGVVFERNAPEIYALQRSELLDLHTCNYCLSIDGRVIEKIDPFGRNTIFHSNCRGIWVAILQDEEEKPSIGGIPQSLRDRFGDAVNDLLQPKKPLRRKR